MPDEEQDDRPGLAQPAQMDRAEVDLQQRQVGQSVADGHHPVPDRVALELKPKRLVVNSVALGADGSRHRSLHFTGLHRQSQITYIAYIYSRN
ncbi:hypothetical protein Ate02nite_57270 [Paractinoplanes tereljensis]|uniref:Uncharacterized protein n=1 Tax=Paractinoplanes tereljensis TaxID=571912 RepID=A0A919NSI6_9ACTN|nr:hypothetical protein Ate02nite_57270 [Actinoplanes tereljensis]